MAAAILYGTEYTRNRSDLVAGAEAQRRLLERQGRGAAAAGRPDTSRYDRALEASDAAIRQLEHEIKLETARLADHRAAEAAARRRVRRPQSVDVSTAAAPADDGAASWGEWSWEGPAREAALHALDVSRREALVKDWREASARKVREDAEYREATTERNSLFEALGWVELEDQRAAASTALAAEVRADQLANGVQARRDAETQRHWKVVRDVFDVANAVGV